MQVIKVAMIKFTRGIYTPIGQPSLKDITGYSLQTIPVSFEPDSYSNAQPVQAYALGWDGWYIDTPMSQEATSG